MSYSLFIKGISYLFVASMLSSASSASYAENCEKSEIIFDNLPPSDELSEVSLAENLNAGPIIRFRVPSDRELDLASDILDMNAMHVGIFYKNGNYLRIGFDPALTNIASLSMFNRSDCADVEVPDPSWAEYRVSDIEADKVVSIDKANGGQSGQVTIIVEKDDASGDYKVFKGLKKSDAAIDAPFRKEDELLSTPDKIRFAAISPSLHRLQMLLVLFEYSPSEFALGLYQVYY